MRVESAPFPWQVKREWNWPATQFHPPTPRTKGAGAHTHTHRIDTCSSSSSVVYVRDLPSPKPPLPKGERGGERGGEKGGHDAHELKEARKGVLESIKALGQGKAEAPKATKPGATAAAAHAHATSVSPFAV